MKTRNRVLSLLLAVTMLLGLVVTASASTPAESITYKEAVELMDALGVTAALGSKSLTAGLTYNEGAAMINALGLDGRGITLLETDRALTFEEFFTLTGVLLCDSGWFSDAPYLRAWLNNSLTGFGAEYDALASRVITGEEACQVLMNAMDAKVQFGATWYLKNEFNLTHEVSTDPAVTDEWCRPVSRWTKDGVALTDWYPASAAYAGEGDITTHNLLERLGIFDFSFFSSNTWCMFNCAANGSGTTWEAPKLHWNHHDQSGCENNWVSPRAGSRMEVYYLGDAYGYIQDAGGEVSYRNYYVVYIDEFLARIDNQNIQIYSNEGDQIWSWSAPELPSANGWYLIHLNLNKGAYATALPVGPARVNRSSQNGMEIANRYYSAYNYVYNNFGKFQLSCKCQLGFDIINSMDYYNSHKRVTFLYDSYGNVIGAIDGAVQQPVGSHDHDWSYVYLSEAEHERWCGSCGLYENVAHTNTELRGQVEATETEPGYTGDLYCLDCGEMLQQGEAINPHAHTYPDTWLYDEDEHWQQCSFENCNYAANKGVHTWKDNKCSLCGVSKEEAQSTLLWWLLGGAGLPFEDVPADAWYYSSVLSAYTSGLIDGMNASTFAPDESLTVAQTIKLAASLHKQLNRSSTALYNGEVNWYDPYVQYAVTNGVIENSYLSYSAAQMNAPISRQEFVHILHGARAFYPISNSVADNAIPDVKLGSSYSSEIYEFYRAGILIGSDAAGTFRPASTIKRSEAAAILVRMYDSSARRSITLG